jgi:hypothetical protein
MSKAVRLEIESAARVAAGRQFNCAPVSSKLAFPNGGALHEFDIFAQDILIGGVSTSPLKVGKGSPNTAGCDRASSEVLWLSLWPGPENRIHVLTDMPLAKWLGNRYRGIQFPHQITIFHYDQAHDALSQVGVFHALSAVRPDLLR